MKRLVAALVAFFLTVAGAAAQAPPIPIQNGGNGAARTYHDTGLPNIVGNGVTDDTAALNAALTTVGAYGSLTLTASRSYLVNSGNLVVPANVKLACQATLTRQTISAQNPFSLPCAILVMEHTRCRWQPMALSCRT